MRRPIWKNVFLRATNSLVPSRSLTDGLGVRHGREIIAPYVYLPTRAGGMRIDDTAGQALARKLGPGDGPIADRRSVGVHIEVPG